MCLLHNDHALYIRELYIDLPRTVIYPLVIKQTIGTQIGRLQFANSFKLIFNDCLTNENTDQVFRLNITFNLRTY